MHNSPAKPGGHGWPAASRMNTLVFAFGLPIGMLSYCWSTTNVVAETVERNRLQVARRDDAVRVDVFAAHGDGSSRDAIDL